MRRWIGGLFYTVALAVGLVNYIARKKTPNFAYQSMIHLFCLTKGHSNDVLSKLIGIFKCPYHFSEVKGILGEMVESERDKVVSQLRVAGCHVFESRLPEDMCDRLLSYATSHPCKTRLMDGEATGNLVAGIYPRGNPQAVRYDFDTQDLLANPDIQNLLADLSLADIAQSYLGARPVIDVLSLWWHTDFSDKPDSEAAQYFHFDMDRPKWLKFFIFLTDVQPTSGPHIYVAGSHKTGAIPSKLLDKGYSRLTDEEVKYHFAKENIIEFVAPCGTILAEDSRGLHKGKHVEQGDRLMLQIQFSNTLFGGYYPKTKMRSVICEKLKNNIARFPDLYSAYT